MWKKDILYTAILYSIILYSGYLSAEVVSALISDVSESERERNV